MLRPLTENVPGHANVMSPPSSVTDACPACSTIFFAALTSIPSFTEMTVTSLSARISNWSVCACNGTGPFAAIA